MFFSVPPDAYGGSRRRGTGSGAAGGPPPPVDGLTALATSRSAATATAPLGYPAAHENSVSASLPALVYGPEGHVPPPPPSVPSHSTTDAAASASADSLANEHDRRVDASFDLPPALLTCLVRHTDGQHQPLATPAIVERCMRELQRQLMPWVPVERLFGSTMQATVPANSKRSALPSAASSAAPPPTAHPYAGSYLAGTRVRLQLAKTTDVAAVSGGTSSVLHLLLYAVDEPTSRPAVLAHIAQEWRAVLARTGEAEESLVLLVHGDLIAAAEAAARLAEEAQRQGRPATATTATTNANAATAQSAPSPPVVVVSQARVDAAAALLRRYYKELREVKFAPQQMCAYMPNETPTRILERLRPAVITRGARLRQAFESCAAQKRMCPQDPRTMPGSPDLATKPSVGAGVVPLTAPLSAPAPAPASPPIRTSSPPPAAVYANSGGAATSGSPRKGGAALTPAPSPALAAQRPASPQHARQQLPAPMPPAPPLASPAAARAPASPSSQPSAGRLWNVQAFWRCGYDLAVHYLQYGLVFDARVVLERLFLEYYNSSDDYVFVRAPAGTLERLGRVPNLFDARGHAIWTVGLTGYPRGLEAGAELLEGLLLVASAEMSCSLLLGDTAAAMTRYHAFMQVTREKFEEWTAAEARSGSSARGGNGSAAGAIKPSTSQQFFLLQCYLSGVRMWWPTSGLCKPLRDLPPALLRATPPPPFNTAAAAVAVATTTTTGATPQVERERSGSVHLGPTAMLPLAKLPSVHGCGDVVESFGAPKQTSDTNHHGEEEEEEAAHERREHETGDTAAAHPGPSVTRHASSLVSITADADGVPDIAPLLRGDTDPLARTPRPDVELEHNISGGSGVRYSITNPSFAFASLGPAGHSFRISSAIASGGGSFSSRPPYGDRSSARRATAPWGSGVHDRDAAAAGAAGSGAAAGAATSTLSAAAAHGEAEDDDEDAAEDGCADELLYLLASGEDTVQAAVAYLVELATATGLLAEHMEPAELHDTAPGLRDALDGGDARTARVLQQHRLRLHRSCTEAASLLEHARDALAAVAHDLGYEHFSYPVRTTAAGPDADAGNNALTGTRAAAAFANVEELSSPDQALRLWRVLTAMAALALRIAEQRRREFHLYARLAVTFLADQPSMTASIVSERLLPFIKRQGWRRIELFVRRLYVEAREQLMRRTGLFASGTEAGSDPARRQLWLQVFRTGAAYVLYRECVLVLLSSDSSSISSSSDSGSGSGSVSMSITGDEDAAVPSRGAEPRAAAAAAVLAETGMAAEDLVGSLDSRLFSARSRSAWWRELLRIDALVMSTVLHGEPPEYPLEHFTTPLTVKLERRVNPAAETSCNDSAMLVNESSMTVQPGALQADVDDVVHIAFVSVFSINPLALPALSEGAAAADSREGAAAVRFQLTLESRKDWGDDDEATHEVHLRDADAVNFDAQTHRLHVRFTFPVCHAGLYRVRRLRLCNGNTWLAYYPQRSCGGGGGGGGGGLGGMGGWVASLLGGGLYAAGWGACQRGAGWRASTTLRTTRLAVDPLYHPVGRAPLLWVPEPRSSVHLRLLLPREAHCFADSVDYVTLEVELEDPLSVYDATGAGSAAAAVTAGPGAPSGPAPLAPQELLSYSGEDARATPAGHATGPTATAAAAATACTCSFEVSAGRLLLPLSAAAVHRGHPPHRSQPYVPLAGCGSSGTAAHDDRESTAPLRRISMSSTALNALLPSMEEDEEGEEAASSHEAGTEQPQPPHRRRRPRFVAAVVLGTPATYRPKHSPASAAAAAAAAAAGRAASPGLSFPSLSAAIPGATGFVGNASGASGVLGMSGSFSARPTPSADGIAPPRHSAPPPTHANAFATSLSSTDAPELAGSAVVAAAAAAGGDGGTRTATPSQQRYKSVFKSLRLGPHTASPAYGDAAAAAVSSSGTLPGASNTPASTSPAAERSRTTSPQRSRTPQLYDAAPHHHHHAHRHARLLRTPSERGMPEPQFAAAGTAADDAANGMEERGSRHMAASISGIIGPTLAPAAAPLREVSAGTFELVLVHTDTATREDRSSAKADASAAAAAAASLPPSTGRTAAASVAAAVAAAAAAAATAARTVLPIHVHDFLQNLPTPEVQVRTPMKGTGGSAAGSLLRAESYMSADPLRETVIRLLPDSSTGTSGERNGNAAAAGVAITHMRLRLPLLPLLTTPITAAALSSKRPPAVVTSCKDAGEEDAAPSAAVTANQARIAFTCVRGREPCTTTLNAVLPFQAAIEFDYVFKHFQGRVYCLVRMRNVLSSTSLWMRGAVLRVLDTEPSYEIVRVCEVYNRLLVTEWKPREELSILYELDLIASFHPAQPECTHRVQMEVFYSSWHRTFLTTPPEDRLVLRTMELPATEATAESVEVIHSDDRGLSDGTALPRTATTTTTTASTGVPTASPATTTSFSQGPLGAGIAAAHAASLPRSASEASSQSLACLSNTHRNDSSRHRSSSSSSSSSTAAMRVGEASHLSDAGDSSTSARSPTEASGAVHFNIVTLRYLEETCNTMWGPIAAFRSKHLCVFSIVMYAESPWTMRFGAATNYLAQPPSTPLSATSTVGGAGGAPLPRTSMHHAGPSSPHLSAHSALSGSPHSGPPSQWGASGGNAEMKPGKANTSFFGNAMVDQPSDVVFVAGEPVRFCVRLQPQAQNWPEDAEMEETFFIRLKYNPAQWMVIGKQRDRRTLSLMEEVTVYFNAVPLLPLASAAADTDVAAAEWGEEEGRAPTAPATGAKTARSAAERDSDSDSDAVEENAAGRGAGAQRSRTLAGHAVQDQGILQTPTVEMFWERKKPPPSPRSHSPSSAAKPPPSESPGAATRAPASQRGGAATAAGAQATSADAVMGEAVLVDVVQFRTWVRVRKRGP